MDLIPEIATQHVFEALFVVFLINLNKLFKEFQAKVTLSSNLKQ